MHNNKVCNSRICTIKVAIIAEHFDTMVQEEIKYEGYILDEFRSRGFDQKEVIHKVNALFPTKEELLKSL